MFTKCWPVVSWRWIFRWSLKLNVGECWQIKTQLDQTGSQIHEKDRLNVSQRRQKVVSLSNESLFCCLRTKYTLKGAFTCTGSVHLLIWSGHVRKDLSRYQDVSFWFKVNGWWINDLKSVLRLYLPVSLWEEFTQSELWADLLEIRSNRYRSEVCVPPSNSLIVSDSLHRHRLDWVFSLCWTLNLLQRTWTEAHGNNDVRSDGRDTYLNLHNDLHVTKLPEY